MNTATLTITTRIRRQRVAMLLVRAASFAGSPRMAQWALGLVRVEWREGRGRWQSLPLKIKVSLS